MRPARRAAAPRAALALIAAAAAISCATARAPSSVPSGEAAAVGAEGDPASPVASRAEEPRAGKARGPAVADAGPLGELGRSYLESSLSRYRRARSASGADIAVLCLGGRKRAALRASIRADRSASRGKEALVDALALAAAVRGPALAAALRDAGAEAELDLEAPGEVALSISCPIGGIEALSRTVAEALASPVFEQDSFEAARRALVLYELKKEGDPISRAIAVAEEGADDAASFLNRITLSTASASWKASFAADRVAIVVVGDVDPQSLAEGLAEAFGALPARAEPSVEARAAVVVTVAAPVAAPAQAEAAAQPARVAAGSLRSAPVTSLPGAAILRVEFPAPLQTEGGAAQSDDYGPMLVAIAMLGDLLEREITAACGSGVRVVAEAPEDPIAPASVTVRGTFDRLAARAAIERSISALASGSCASTSPVEPLSPIASRLGRYKAKALVALYEGGSSPEIAARVTRSIAAGGDGTDYFRAAALIASVGADDVLRAARARLAEGSSAWAVVGDPSIAGGLAAQGSR